MKLKTLFALSFLGLFVAAPAAADERLFTYSYEADVLPEDSLEFEQWITARNGRDGGDYTRWEFREELEYGITDALTSALYLNFQDTYFSPDNEEEESEREFEFSGISSEWKYQILNPNLDPVGAVIYFEGTVGSDEAELEEKIILSSNLSDSLVLAFNATLEQEWEYEHSETEEEGKLELTSGLAYKITPKLSVGLEIRNIRIYETLGLDNEEHVAWYLGPNIHYAAPKWWATLAVLPQIGLEGARDLEDNERINVRAIVGIHL